MEQKEKGRSEPHGIRDEKASECDRCGGLCGEVIDPLILENRRSPPPNLLYGTKQRNYGQRIIATDPTSKNHSDVEGNEENQQSEDA
ncbi:MAG: hypothetical protein ABW047_12630 [Nitrospiraceae bacterium]